MAYRGILMISVLLCCGSAASVSAAVQHVPVGYIRVAVAHGVPAEALYSVSLTESSRRIPQGNRPWPWTLNVAGSGYRYETRLQAWQALEKFMQHYPLKRIDVGIAQVNLGWNGHYFASTWEAFEPYTNLNAAASILRTCWERNPGSWLDAAGCYHHPAGGQPAERYRFRVQQHLQQIALITPSVPVFQAQPAALTSAASFVWIEPES